MLRILNDQVWSVVPTSTTTARGARARGATRGAGPAADSVLPQEILLDGVSVEEVHQVAQAPARRGLADRVVDLEVDAAAGESALIAVRHPSGAVTFHAPVLASSPSRGGARGVARGASASLRFRVETPLAESQTRGIVSAALKFLVVKITEPAIDAARRVAAELLAKGGERLLWKARDLTTGWHRVVVTSDGLKLAHASPSEIDVSDRSLLLIHGTFSNAAGAFGPLARTSFFDAVRPLYGDRIFAFNHYTISDEPEENVRDLLEALPERGCSFDVVTHSRGGLVLRHAVERHDLFGAKADRFRLGRAVLVASPNAGTPLATPGRYEQTFGLLANLLEILPDNPWTTLPELLANGIVWLASNVIPAMRGVAVMDRDSATLHALEAPPGPPLSAYSALCSSYEPASGVLTKLLDAGIDRFFDGANDLVVPTAGGWRVDDSFSAIPPERIGCFGPGGNLRTTSGEPVSHVDFFRHEAAAEFIAARLAGKAQTIEVLDPDRPLPTRLARRGVAPSSTLTLGDRSASEARASGNAPHAEPRAGAAETSGSSSVTFPSRFVGDDVLHLMILEEPPRPGEDTSRRARILGMYNGARTLADFPTRNDAAELRARAKERRAARTKPAASHGNAGAIAKADGPGDRFRRIIDMHHRIRRLLTSQPDAATGRVPDPPSAADLKRFGVDLFDALFVGGIKRLYDVARSEQRERPLNVVVTSAVPWLAALPWELTVDPDRKKFLVTEEVHLVRNVLTTVPAERLTPLDGDDPLRILVVVAQPLDAPVLSSQDELDQILAGFRRLMQSKLVTVDVLTNVTAARLHRKLEGAVRENRDRSAARSGSDREERRGYDVIHFIGHGEFDEEAAAGTLIFTDAVGHMQPVRIQQLREILCGRGARLVFLNACDTAEDDYESLNRGVAQALVEAGLPAVVANQYPVLDPSAVAFAEHFYWSLATGATLGEAAREARIALGYALGGDSIDAAVPVLYARDPSYRLCQPRMVPLSAPRPEPTHSETASTARRRRAPSAAAHPVLRVGVADLTHTFIGIDALLDRLSRAQQRIEFERVTLVAPLGVWNQKSAKGRTYLNAAAFMERIKGKPQEIGVDYLIAITDRWLTDDELGDDFYSWWSDAEDQRVLVFSVAGFDIPRRGPLMQQVLGNELISSLAAKLLDTATHTDPMHERGAGDCPFYFNEERDFDPMRSRQRFDATCRAKLVKGLPAKVHPPSLVAAFDAALAAAGGE